MNLSPFPLGCNNLSRHICPHFPRLKQWSVLPSSVHLLSASGASFTPSNCGLVHPVQPTKSSSYLISYINFFSWRVKLQGVKKYIKYKRALQRSIMILFHKWRHVINANHNNAKKEKQGIKRNIKHLLTPPSPPGRIPVLLACSSLSSLITV